MAKADQRHVNCRINWRRLESRWILRLIMAEWNTSKSSIVFLLIQKENGDLESNWVRFSCKHCKLRMERINQGLTEWLDLYTYVDWSNLILLSFHDPWSYETGVTHDNVNLLPARSIYWMNEPTSSIIIIAHWGIILKDEDTNTEKRWSATEYLHYVFRGTMSDYSIMLYKVLNSKEQSHVTYAN